MNNTTKTNRKMQQEIFGICQNTIPAKKEKLNPKKKN